MPVIGVPGDVGVLRGVDLGAVDHHHDDVGTVDRALVPPGENITVDAVVVATRATLDRSPATTSA